MDMMKESKAKNAAILEALVRMAFRNTELTRREEGGEDGQMLALQQNGQVEKVLG